MKEKIEKEERNYLDPKFDFESFQKEAISRLYNKEPLIGKDGILTPMIKQFLEKALSAELDDHLGYLRNKVSANENRRNGSTKKNIKVSSGTFELETPRDRNGTFEPEIVKKRQTVLNDEIDPKIISLYASGMSYADIERHIRDIYGIEMSDSLFTSITDKIIPEIREWQTRPLEPLYLFVWLDAMFVKIREAGKVVTKGIYTILGIDSNGHKDILGMYIHETEGANFWLSVLTDLSNRGVKDILIACIDNLKGFAEAIEASFPRTEVQLCVIHQIRNSLKYVASKDQKSFMRDLKNVYRASTKIEAEMYLDNLETVWGAKYPLVIKSWRNNWERLSNYFKYPEQIRRVIYTTNAIEGFHRQIRKVIKSKGAFSSDMAFTKLWYLATQNIMKKWTMPMQNWAATISQLSIFFEKRLNMEISL